MTTAASGVSTRGVARDALIYGAGFVASRLASLLLLPLYTRVLTPTDYGVLQLLQTSLDVVDIIVSAGVSAGVIRLYQKETTEEGKRSLLASAFAGTLGRRAAGALAVVLAAPWLSTWIFDTAAYAPHVRLAGVNFLVGALTLVPLLHLRALREARWFTIVSTGRLVLQLLLNALFVLVFGWGVLGVLFAAFVSASAVGVPLAARFVTRVGWRPGRAQMAALRTFGAPYQVSSVAAFILGFGDRFFLNARSTAEVGLYGLAYQFGILLSSVAYEPFSRAYEPVAYQLERLPAEERDARVNRNFLLLSVILLVSGAGLALFAGPVLRVMSAPPFHPAAALVGPIAAAYVIRSWGEFFRLGVNIGGETRYVTYATWAGAAACLVLYAALIPVMGMWGAAIATIAGFTVRTVVMFRLAQRSWPVAWRFAPVARLSFVAVTLVVANDRWHPHAVAGQFAASVAWAVLFGTLCWGFGLPSGMRAEIVREARRVMARFGIGRIPLP